MMLVGFVLGFADFALALPLQEAAALLSRHVFGGIPFIDHDRDDIDGGPSLILQCDFVGINAELFGKEGEYTLEINTRPSASVEEINVVCDLSAMVKQQLLQIPGLTLVDLKP
jgi:hypothetical protein